MSIRQLVSPASWREVGGRGHIAIDEDAASLVIRQTARVHEDIAAILALLRKMRRPSNRPESEKHDDGALRRMHNSLQQPVSLEFEQAPLAQVMEAFASAVNVNVVLDEPGLNEEGVTSKTPVTVKQKDLPAETALRHILHPLGLSYSLQGEVVRITSRRRSDGDPVAIVYPVGDLIGDSDGPKSSKPGDHVRNDFGQMRELSERIQSCVWPESWEDRSRWGSISLHPTTGSLVVRQVPPVHEEVVRLLASLREQEEVGLVKKVPAGTARE